MISIYFSRPTRQLFVLYTFIFIIGSAWGQSNPYQSECARFTANLTVLCAPYSNCRLLGGSPDECVSKVEASNKKPASTIKEAMDKEASDKAAREKWATEDSQRRQQQDWQNQQQQLQLQYQQNKK